MRKFSKCIVLMATVMLWSVATVSAADLLFDDFSDASINTSVWALTGGTAVVSNGEAVLTGATLQSQIHFLPGVTMECRVKAPEPGDWGDAWAFNSGGNWAGFIKPAVYLINLTDVAIATDWYGVFYPWDLTNVPVGFDARDYHTYRIVYDNGKQEYYIDNYLVLSTSAPRTNSIPVRLTGDLVVDWVRVYLSNEPPQVSVRDAKAQVVYNNVAGNGHFLINGHFNISDPEGDPIPDMSMIDAISITFHGVDDDGIAVDITSNDIPVKILGNSKQ